ncbi:uncharacterized protein LACBIDRAFT_327986 [Laccaria bicolor S238N-H82]|uniref:Predicted protein n=1 Tax=Laccaria bicolor (strain S238N-H82 / ATCC MYA-4686) TaxID=486041 RepID=B0DDG2_LACBS|nr:uncharacterized protein LACBIDRAFT_327986 [Laccaria bicolor S238N-H82]EDR07472.1 predicted protein [Laccaria bicolor S238N-H82]|eukprot:XP_001881864.1 predicted protein [Laccaria bicolor S238N-H82]
MCGDSFTAADEKQVKASTQFFSDTGLMALLCEHDRVLWLVNMTSAGEKQHYALVLLEHLFNHLPSTARVAEILWNLFEQNFRLELRMVDQQVLPANWASQELAAVRDELVWRTFPEDDDGYIVGRLPETNVGLVTENWRDRARKVLGSDKSALSVIDILLSSPFFVCPSLSQVIMSMYKKKPAKSLPPENAGLFPVNTAPKSLKAHKAVKGNLYTPAGHFVQPFKPGVSKKADPFQPLATTLTFENEGDTVQLPGKKQKQFQHWETEVFPSLMEPYVKLLHETDSLQDMVQFVNELFVNAAPNTTAWCETLETFLGNRRYKLTTRFVSSFWKCYAVIRMLEWNKV